MKRLQRTCIVCGHRSVFGRCRKCQDGRYRKDEDARLSFVVLNWKYLPDNYTYAKELVLQQFDGEWERR